MTEKFLTTIQLCIEMVIVQNKSAMLYTEKWCVRMNPEKQKQSRTKCGM